MSAPGPSPPRKVRLRASLAFAHSAQTFIWLETTGEILFVLASNQMLPSPWQDSLLWLITFGDPAFSGPSTRVTPAFVLGTTLVVLGAQLRLAGKRALGAHFTYELAVQRGHKLVTSGPYSIVRHPGYTGGIAAALGADLALFLAHGGWVREAVWPWMTQRGGALGSVLAGLFVLSVPAVQVVMIGALVARVPVEDQMMRNEFGAQWDAWARRVPYKLIPGIY
jgi:protein-S-isoprenylcysteine O-methyltransferase Ste14